MIHKSNDSHVPADHTTVTLLDEFDDATIEVPALIWITMLSLAREFGWEPEGTIHRSRRENWDGCYFPIAEQNITGTDATALQAALERALDAIPDFDARTPEEAEKPWPSARIALSGAHKRFVRAVALFLADTPILICSQDDALNEQGPRLILHHSDRESSTVRREQSCRSVSRRKDD